MLQQAEMTLDELPALAPGAPPLPRTLQLLLPSKGASRSRGSAAAECGLLRVELSDVRPPAPPVAPLTGVCGGVLWFVGGVVTVRMNSPGLCFGGAPALKQEI